MAAVGPARVAMMAVTDTMAAMEGDSVSVTAGSATMAAMEGASLAQMPVNGENGSYFEDDHDDGNERHAVDGLPCSVAQACGGDGRDSESRGTVRGGANAGAPAPHAICAAKHRDGNTVVERGCRQGEGARHCEDSQRRPPAVAAARWVAFCSDKNKCIDNLSRCLPSISGCAFQSIYCCYRYRKK